MKSRHLFLICLFVQAFSMPVAVIAEEIDKKEYTKEQVHGTNQDCTICHDSHDMSGTGLMKPVSGLCLECHPDRNKPLVEHKVDIVPSMDVGELPLIKGKMTCVTCHDSHKSTYNKMLRIDPAKLCLVCHQY